MKYTDEERDKGLRALVLADGSVRKACERLAAAGEDIPYRTLADWRNKHSERYEELAEDRNSWVAKRMADDSEFLAAGYAESEARLVANVLARDDAELQKLSPNVLLQAARNASIARGVSIDKANELRQRPTRPDGSAMDPMRALALLMDKFSHVVPAAKEMQAIESSATEVKEDHGPA